MKKQSFYSKNQKIETFVLAYFSKSAVFDIYDLISTKRKNSNYLLKYSENKQKHGQKIDKMIKWVMVNDNLP